MAKRYTKGTVQIASEVEISLAEAVRAFARTRGETLREVVEMALRRHLANPPAKVEPPPLPPLPPFPPPSVAAKKVDKKK